MTLIPFHSIPLVNKRMGGGCIRIGCYDPVDKNVNVSARTRGHAFQVSTVKCTPDGGNVA